MRRVVLLILALAALSAAGVANAAGPCGAGGCVRHLPRARHFDRWQTSATFPADATLALNVYSRGHAVQKVGSSRGCVLWFVGRGVILRAATCGQNSPLRIQYRSPRAPVAIALRRLPG